MTVVLHCGLPPVKGKFFTAGFRRKGGTYSFPIDLITTVFYDAGAMMELHDDYDTAQVPSVVYKVPGFTHHMPENYEITNGASIFGHGYGTAVHKGGSCHRMNSESEKDEGRG